MKKILSFFILFSIALSAYAQTYEGTVSERNAKRTNRIIDKSTGHGVDGATIILAFVNS